MLVLEATSAQTDLVAAALALAVVVAAIPFLGARRVGLREGLMLGTCLGTAVVTKMTAAVAALPFVLAAVAHSVRVARRGMPARIGAWIAVAAVVAGLSGLEIDRVRILRTVPGHVAAYAFSGWGEWPQRAANVVQATLRNLPLAPALSRAVQVRDCPRRAWCDNVLLPNEDLAGEPLHTAFVGLLFLATLVRRRTLPRRTRLFAGLLLAAWIGFHCVFRDNLWFMRLQLPLFGLAPLLFGAIRPRRRATSVALGALAALAWVVALSVAVRNERRPPLEPGRVDYAHSYYTGGEWVGLLHDAALSAAARTHCPRMSLYLGQETGSEYALVWRAMHAGIEVRHLVSGWDPWPCLLVTDPSGTPPPGWEPAGETGRAARAVWVRNTAH
jgi:hypothetical protein